LKGYGDDGPFSVTKRYSDFLKLRIVLIQRWPGFYMPSLPPKKTLGNMDNEFVAIRMEHLNNFIQMLAQYKFLLDSFEFKTFLKYTSTELDTQYKALLVE
jgi:sorting nexin-1/2